MRMLLEHRQDLAALFVAELTAGQPGGDQVALFVPGKGWARQYTDEDQGHHVLHRFPHDRSRDFTCRWRRTNGIGPVRLGINNRTIVRLWCSYFFSSTLIWSGPSTAICGFSR
jgi:hypothetical protein